MYKIHKDKALAGAIVTTIIILAGAVAGVLTYKESAMTTDTALDGTYEAYEVLTNDKLDQPYHVPESAYAGAITGSEKQAEKKNSYYGDIDGSCIDDYRRDLCRLCQ